MMMRSYIGGGTPYVALSKGEWKEFDRFWECDRSPWLISFSFNSAPKGGNYMQMRAEKSGCIEGLRTDEVLTVESMVRRYGAAMFEDL